MSGIYGFTCRTPGPGTTEYALQSLDRWNGEYGREAAGQSLMGRSGIGCRVEHFSDRFPHGAPVIEFEGGNAVVDALLYNRDELTAELGLSDDAALSDEALLLKLIHTRGYEALAMVNGDFAGAVFDAEQHRWTLFRDHMGVRPLFYYMDGDQFAFSTDIRGLCALPGADLRPDELNLYKQMVNANILTLCGTDYQKIRAVRPASWSVVHIEAEGFGYDEHIYWRLKQQKLRLGSDEAYQQRLRELITDSVRRRLDAIPGKIGAELSGGLDSSVIDILISRLGREGVFYSWSLTPEELPLRRGLDERKIIDDICRQEGIDCHYYSEQETFGFSDLLENVMPAHTESLSITTGSAWLRSQGARVVFSGHGGDEGVSARCSPYALLYNREYRAYLKYYWDCTRGQKLRLLRTLKRAIRDAIIDHRNAADVSTPRTSNASGLMTEAFRERISRSYPGQRRYFGYDPVKYINQGGTRVRLESAAYQGARNGVRYLFPYVDHRVIDFAVSIPRAQFLNSSQNRRVFREAFRELMPESLYCVNYKDFRSLRGAKRTVDYRGIFRQEMDILLSRLDRDYWKDILDFEAIEAMELPEDQTSDLFMQLHYCKLQLKRCLLAQNVRDRAHEKEATNG